MEIDHVSFQQDAAQAVTSCTLLLVDVYCCVARLLMCFTVHNDGI